MAKAARWISLERHGGESPMSSCQNCPTAGSMAAEPSVKILFDNDTQPLLTPSFWILPLYRELLNSARRIRPSASSERARGCTGLVKIICKENKEQRGKRKYHAGTPHPNDRGIYPMVWVVQLNEYALYMVSSQLGTDGS